MRCKSELHSACSQPTNSSRYSLLIIADEIFVVCKLIHQFIPLFCTDNFKRDTYNHLATNMLSKLSKSNADTFSE